jgi:hypothetical protein
MALARVAREHAYLAEQVASPVIVAKWHASGTEQVALPEIFAL